MYEGPERRRDDGRLDRIEKKIDQLSDAMVALARTEEKLVSIEKNNSAAYDRLNAHGRKLDEIESRLVKQESQMNTISRLFWIAISVAAAAFASHFLAG